MRIRFVAAMAAFLSLGACASVEAPGALSFLSLRAAPDFSGQDWSLADLRVDVPRALTVSEANDYVPGADIVWRDDPFGDRHAQVARVVEGGLADALGGMVGARAVVVEVEITRFHALSQRARYSTGGRHAIRFDLTVRDAATGAVLAGPVPVDASFAALGGADAVASEAQGIGQTERIQAHLDAWARETFGSAAEAV